MATKINASDVNVMTFNAAPFVASDEYGEEDCPATLEGLDTPSHCKVVDTNTGKAIVGFTSFAEAEEIAKKYYLTMHSYTKRDGERVWTDCGWEDAPFDMRKAFIEVDRLSLYEKSDAESLREDAASFDEDEEALAERLNDIADVLDKMNEDQILVVFNDVPELTYEVWDRHRVGYHDYDVHQFEIGLKK